MPSSIIEVINKEFKDNVLHKIIQKHIVKKTLQTQSYNVGIFIPSPHMHHFFFTPPDCKGSHDVLPNISKEIEKFGSFKVIKESNLCKELGIEQANLASSDAKIRSYLNTLHLEFSYVIYIFDGSSPYWMHICLRNVDALYVLIDTAFHRKTLSVPDPVLNAKLPKDALFLHEKWNNTFSGSRQFLESIHAKNHLHLHLNKTDWTGRFVRRILKKEVAIVLSSGGARGFLHFGVLQALIEEEIPIDMVSGTSQGSFVGGAYSYYGDLEKAKERLLSIFENFEFDYTLPILSMMTGEMLLKELQNIFGDTKVEDLPLNFLCESFDLVTHQLVPHTREEVAYAIRASMALPIIFPPFILNNQVLVDGATSNGMPLRATKEKWKPAWMMGVDVGEDTEIKETYEDKAFESVTGLEILWNLVNPFQEKPAILITDILKWVMFSYGYNEKKRDIEETVANLLIYPPSKGISTVRTENLNEVIDIGYTFAKENIGNWKKELCQVLYSNQEN